MFFPHHFLYLIEVFVSEKERKHLLWHNLYKVNQNNGSLSVLPFVPKMHVLFF